MNINPAELESILAADQRDHAVLADIHQAATLKYERDVRAMEARIGPLKLHQTLNELQRAQAGIDHTGKRLPRFGAVLADCRASDADEAWDAQMRRESAESTAEGAFDDARGLT